LPKKILPTACPSCKGQLKVQMLNCASCQTAVEGSFDLPLLAQLPEEDQDFILQLIKFSGSLKELSAFYGISYPTVRNRLDSLIEKVEQVRTSNNHSLED
jgi:hypothetical protein